MAMRLSGLMSGMDTESIISQLVEARRTKVDSTKKAQTKLQWTQDAWKTLNSKIVKLYNGALSNLRFESSYMKKVTKVSNSSVVSVITGDGAMNSVQSLKVKQMAQSGYLTGGQLGDGKQGYTIDNRLNTLGVGFDTQASIKVTVGGEEKEINLNGWSTIGDVVEAFQKVGIEASFDATNQRFYLASKDTGTENDFSVSAGNAAGLQVLQKLGLDYVDENSRAEYQEKVDSKDKILEEQKAAALEYLQSEKARVQTQMNKKIDDLKELGFTNVSSIEDVDISAIRDEMEKLKDSEDEGDQEKYKELQDWIGGWNVLSGQLKDINEQLTTDEDGNETLSEEMEKSVTESVDDMITMYEKTLAGGGAIKNAALDAIIELNGVEYTQSRNTFEINGLTLTINATTGENETVTLTTQDDTDGIYDMIKNFLKEYNELINEMDKLYNADSSRGYEPLTSEEKEAMSDSEIEEWEKKIKDSLLRRDSTLGDVSNMLKQMMLEGATVNGQKMYLSNFGIGTLSYFVAGENEKNALHIDGDPDDTNTSGETDKLRSMIANDPETVVSFFVELSRNLYSKLTDKMARTEYSSSYTIYEDIRMKNEYDDYTTKIKELEEKLADYEDKWYQKFAEMESAMAKMQSNASAVTALLGG